MMRRLVACCSLSLGLASIAYADAPKTYFDYIERSWACAEVEPRSPMTFRDGFVLAFPGSLVDVVYARNGKPQSVMLIEELASKGATPFIEKDVHFFAPIQVLPDHSYWRDNLPNTPRHGILGGHRYVFKGDDLAPAKDLAAAYAATIPLGMPERRQRQQAIVVEALTSKVAVLREDALRRLTSVPVPASQYDPATIRRIGEIIKSDAPATERAALVAMTGPAGMTALVPDLELLAKRDDVVGANALAALEILGFPRETPVLITLLGASTVEVRAYAAHGLGTRAGDSGEVLERITVVLESDDDPTVRAAAATGLGGTENPAVLDVLVVALGRGDEVSRAAALAIANVDSPRSVQVLKNAVLEGPNEAQVGGVLALVRLQQDCSDCVAFLREQHGSHPDAAVRDLIAIVLELNVRHDH